MYHRLPQFDEFDTRDRRRYAFEPGVSYENIDEKANECSGAGGGILGRNAGL